jgi:hypothetical protein
MKAGAGAGGRGCDTNGLERKKKSENASIGGRQR